MSLMIKNTLLTTIFLSLLPFSITIISKPALANCPPGQVHGLFGVCRRQIYCPDGVPTGTNGCIPRISTPDEPWWATTSKSRITPVPGGRRPTFSIGLVTVTNSCDVPLALVVKSLNGENQWEDSPVNLLQPSQDYTFGTKQPDQYYLYANSSKGTWTGSDATIYVNGQAFGMIQRSGSTSITCN